MSLHQGSMIAFKALRKNKLQTSLTILGMTIGVATVLTMINIGTGAQNAIEGQVRAAGMNILIVTAGNYKMPQQWTSLGEAEEPAAWHPLSRHKLLLREAIEYHPQRSAQLLLSGSPADNPIQQLERGGQNKGGLGAATTLSLDDARSVEKIEAVQNVSGGIKETATLISGNTRWFTHMHGEEVSLPLIRRAWIFPAGRFFNQRELRKSAHVVVIGSVVRDHLFPGQDPIGRTIFIRGTDFTVVGVMASGSWMVPAAPGDDQFDAVYIPVTSAQELLRRSYLDTLTLSVNSTGDVTHVLKETASLLRTRHGITTAMPDDFVVTSQADKLLAHGGMRTDIARAVVGNTAGLDKVTLHQLSKTLEKASRTMTALLVSTAIVSLIVGGIGIMNIMILSVTERTSEIGIRRAVGARSQDVMRQFLFEAIALSIGGGIAGILVGLVASVLIARYVQWAVSISPIAILLSFGVAAGVGILFGYYPAREASRVSPMISLRYE